MALLLVSMKQAHGQAVESIAPYYEVPQPCAKYLDEIEKYPWDTAMVARIMNAESNCNPKNHNYSDSHKTCTGSWNLMSVGCLHYKNGESKDDISLNIRKSYQVYKESGYSFCPWTTYRKMRPESCKR